MGVGLPIYENSYSKRYKMSARRFASQKPIFTWSFGGQKLSFQSVLKPERGSRRCNHRKDIPANSAAFSPDLCCEPVHSTRVNLLAAAARRPR